MTPENRLQDLATGILPLGVAFGACRIGEGADLWPEEMMATLSMVPARRAEFAAGRRAARRAMTVAGLPLAPIPMDADRAPAWPDGVVGSISHCDDLAVAICADARWRGLGIDLERDGPCDPDLAETVLTPAEAGLPARLAFCLKEAAYKAQYRVTRQIFGFDQLRLEVRPDGFVARFTADLGPFAAGEGIEGRYCRADGLILAVAALR